MPAVIRGARALALALLLVAAAPLASAQSQWIVDAAGGGQFTTLQAAIDAAAPGDVLLVLPGTYSAAVLTKELSILGDPAVARPHLVSFVVKSAPAFRLAHLELRRLHVRDVPGRSVIDDCRFDGACIYDQVAGTGDLVLLEGADDLVLSRSTLDDGFDFALNACGTLRVRGGTLNLVDCFVDGGTFGGGIGPHASSSGRPAMIVEQGARVWIAASTLWGGDGHNGDGGGGESGSAGAALVVASGAEVDLRGTAAD